MRLVPYSGDDRVEVALIERNSHQALMLTRYGDFLLQTRAYIAGVGDGSSLRDVIYFETKTGLFRKKCSIFRP